MSLRNPKAVALSYAARDWHVFPVHEISDGVCTCPGDHACQRPGKHPRTPNGVHDATTDAKQINEWWTRWRRANIGVATGTPSGILVLDVDPRNGGFETLHDLQEQLGRLPKTPTAVTGGGGRHYILQLPQGPIAATGRRLGPGIDTLDSGKYFVAPYSRHVSGNRYRWRKGLSIDDVEPAELPATWLACLTGQADKPESTPSNADQISEGQRNTRLTSLAGKLWRAGMSGEVLLAALLEENANRCQPPLDRAEIAKIVASVTKYPPGAGVGDNAAGIARDVLAHEFADGTHLRYGIDGRFWHYDVCYWRPVPDKWVEGRILAVIEAQSDKGGRNDATLVRQARALIEAKLAVKDDQFGLVTEPPLVINCANGELWLLPDGSVELRPHRPESNLAHCLNIAYDPNATCPLFDKAVAAIFEKAKDPKGMIRHWHELAGYLTQPRRTIPIIIVLLGDGSNGKTSLVRTLMRLLGAGLAQAQQLDALEGNRFAIGNLFGKRVFVDDDVKANTRLPDGILKVMSEAKEVTGELKFGPTFNFIMRAAPILLCNSIPSLADVTHGMLRRLMVVPFNRTFTLADIDRGLFDRITASELPGILNRALAGLKRVIRRGWNFRYPDDIERAQEAFLGDANPLPAFIDEHCISKPSARILLRVFYDAYVEWAKGAGITMVQQRRSVRRNLNHLGFPVKHGNRGETVFGLELK